MTAQFNTQTRQLSVAILFIAHFLIQSMTGFAQCGPNLSGVISTSGTYTGPMTLSGNVTITGPGVIVNFTNLTLGANATTRQITVTNGAVLNINQSSQLGVCAPTTSWVGVRVNATAQVNMSNSSILNATTGINVVNGAVIADFNVQNSTFSNNTTGIAVNAYVGAHSGILLNSNFVSTGTGTGVRITGPTTGTMNFAPFAGNNFANLATGIISNNSNQVALFANTFSNSTNGVTATNAAANPTATLDTRNNKFLACSSNGISVNGDVNEIHNQNNFMSFVSGMGIRSVNGINNGKIVNANVFQNYWDGVLFQNFDNCQVHIMGNNFTDNPARTSISCIGNINSSVHVVSNTLVNNISDGTSAISMTSSPASGPIKIAMNSISNYINGIICTSINSPILGQFMNKVNWVIPSSAGAHYGIKNTTCINVQTEDNDVQMSNLSTNTFTGIYYSNSDNVLVKCNHVLNGTTLSTGRVGYDFNRSAASFANLTVTDNEDRGLSFGFRFIASVVGAYPITFVNNRMDSDASAGLRLQGWGIGNQGNPTTACWNRFWACGISRTAATPIPTFYTSATPMPQEIAVPAAFCPFIPSSMVTFTSAGTINYISPCNPPINFKEVSTASTNPTALMDELLSNITTSETLPEISFAENKAQPNVEVYPNPARDIVTIAAAMEDSAIGIVTLFDMNGRMVKQTGINTGQVSLDISELNSGVYVYQIAVNNEIIKVEKLVINK
jgi:hypothetical protein